MNSSLPPPPSKAVTSITVNDLPKPTGAWLMKHGCRFEWGEDCIIVNFPEGTTEVEVLPRVRDSRYKVTLPDGAHCYEHLLAGYAGERSAILIPKEDTPTS